MTTVQTTLETRNPEASIFREWAHLPGASERYPCPRGTVIYSPGEPGECVFLVKSGKVKILRLGPDGERLIVNLVRPGEIFGELALLGMPFRESCAEVLEDAALAVIPAGSIVEWLRDRPESWRDLSVFLGRRVRYLEGAVERLFFGEVEQRIVRLLLELAKQYGEPSASGVSLAIELSQKEVAHLIGSTRETTSSALNLLRKRGLIQIRRRRLSICSLPELSQAFQKSLPAKRPPASEGMPRVAAVRVVGAGS